MKNRGIHSEIIDHLTWCLESKSVSRKEAADAIAAYRDRPASDLDQGLDTLESEQALDDDLLSIIKGARAVLAGTLSVETWMVTSWQYQGLM